MITSGQQASATALSRAYGFDDKFVVKVGDSFDFASNEELYEEPSGFKRDGVDVPSIFFGWEVNGKKRALSVGAVTRSTVPQSAIQSLIKSEGDCTAQPLFAGRKTAQEVRDFLRGKRITLMGITSYEVPSRENPRLTWNGKAYYWRIG